MKQIKLPVSVSHSKNFGINNINNGLCVFKGYQDVGLIEGAIKGEEVGSITDTNVRVMRKFFKDNDLSLGLFKDDKCSVYNQNLEHLYDINYTDTTNNNVSELDISKFATTDTSAVLYTGQVDNTDDYIGFESTNFIIVDTSGGNLTPGAYKDKVLKFDKDNTEYAIIGNTFNKIFIQDVFDSDINGGDGFKIYDTKVVGIHTGNFNIQNGDYKYLIGPFKNRLIAYSPTKEKIIYSYVGISTNHTNKYNTVNIGQGYNGLKVLNIDGQEKLFIFGNGEVKILDFIGDILGIVGTYKINKNVLDIVLYNGAVILLTEEGIYGLSGKKLNKLFDIIADNNSCLSIEDKYLVVNNVFIEGEKSTVLLDGFDRVSILKGVNSIIYYKDTTYIQVGNQISKYVFEENGYVNDKNNHNIVIEFNPIYNIDAYNNIAVYVDNIPGKDKDFIRGNVVVQVDWGEGYTTLQESDYNNYNGYFVLNYDYNGLKHKMDGKLKLKVQSNIPIFGIYLTTTK